MKPRATSSPSGKDDLMMTALFIIFGLIGGIAVVLVVSFLVLSYENGKRQDLAQLWGAEYGVRQVQRANVKIRILFAISGPECPDGRFSPLQMAMWNQYQALDDADQKLTARERDAIVELRGYS